MHNFLPFLILFTPFSSSFCSMEVQGHFPSSTRAIPGACGGVTSGTLVQNFIEYKLHQEYQANERCVWVIQNNAQGRVIHLTLTEANFTNSDDLLEIYASGQNELIHGKDAELVSYSGGLLRRTGDTISLAFPAIALVVLKTQNLTQGPGTGFRLGHQLSLFHLPKPFYLGQHFVYGEPTGFFEHFPLGYGQWRDYTFVICPTNGNGTQLTLHYLNFSRHSTATINLYVASSGSITLFNKYRQAQAPILIDVGATGSREPLFLHFRIASAEWYRGVDVGIQAYWNLNSPPNFTHVPNSASSTTTPATTTRNLVDGAVTVEIGGCAVLSFKWLQIFLGGGLLILNFVAIF